MSYAPVGGPPSVPLSFSEALRLAWARKFEVAGRSRRSEYWWASLGIFLAMLATVLVVLVLVGVGAAIGHGVQVLTDIVAALVGVVAYVGAAVLGIVLQVRRLHDTDKSGWFWLINLVPSVGGIIVFVFTVLDSTPGPNRYGPWPKAPEGAVGPGGPWGGAPASGWGQPAGAPWAVDAGGPYGGAPAGHPHGHDGGSWSGGDHGVGYGGGGDGGGDGGDAGGASRSG